MALPSTGVWEIQTTGDDTNGGMFDPSVTSAGTDYTYGAGQTVIPYSDLASTNGNATSPQVTSATRPFISADVGNTIQISSGTSWTIGFFNIRSVSGGAATLDRACGSVASLSGGNGKLGGAVASLGKISGTSMITGGNTVWIKSGTYTVTTATANVSGGRVNCLAAGLQSTPILIQGYNLTRGDFSTRPVITTNVASSFALVSFSNGGVIYRNIEFVGNTATTTTGCSFGTTGGIVDNCKFTDCLGGGVGLGTTIFKSLVTRCSFTNCGTTNAAATAACFMECVSYNNPGPSAFRLLDGGVAVNCLAYGNTNAGFEAFGIATMYHECTSYGNGVGFSAGTSTTADLCATYHNCIAYANTNEGFKSQTPQSQVFNCAEGANGLASSVIGLVINMITLTTDPFVNAAGANFALNDVSGGGAACRGAGSPASYLINGTASSSDIGAAQHPDRASYSYTL